LFSEKSFDVVMACHTLHHLDDPWPIKAVQEMFRLSRRFVVIVEVNNTNIPVLALTLLTRSVERNAFRYNLSRVTGLVTACGHRIIHAGHLSRGYISSSSLPYRMMAGIGKPPYNIVIAEKR
jgi:hypothetical protein